MIGTVGGWRQTTAIAAIACLVTALGGGCVHRGTARPQVVVLDIRGAHVGAVQRHIDDLAGRRFEVVSADRYWAMARRLHAKAMTAHNVAKVAGGLGAVAVVEGRARGSRRHRVITLLVRDGHSGKVIEKHRVVLRHGRVLAHSDARLDKRFLAAVHAPPPPAPAASRSRTAARASAEPERGADSARDKGAEADHRADRHGRDQKARHGKSAADQDQPPPPSLPPVKYDDRGQAIDDEQPPPAK